MELVENILVNACPTHQRPASTMMGRAHLSHCSQGLMEKFLEHTKQAWTGKWSQAVLGLYLILVWSEVVL